MSSTFLLLFNIFVDSQHFSWYIKVTQGGDKMNERLKSLRKETHLTQQEFADRLKISRNNIATYETGKSRPGDSVIALICREFDVNENWLRTGVGEMFVQLDKDEEFDRLCMEIQLSDDEFIKDIIRKYWHLDDKGKSTIRQMLSGLSDQ